MSDDKVIHAFKGKELPENPLVVEHKQGYCEHRKVRLIEHDRNVVCAECGASLDPFDYLRQNAFAIRSAWDAHRQVMNLASERRTQVDALEKEKRRLQAQVRRLKEQAGDPLDFRKPL